IAAGVEPVHHEDLLLGMDDPVVRDAVFLEHLQLVDEVAFLVAGRQELADPVGTGPDRTLAWDTRQALDSPAGDVRAIHLVRLVLDLALRDDPPSATSALESAARPGTHAELRVGMLEAWTGLVNDAPMDDLGARIVGQRRQIRGGRRSRT